MNSNWDSQENFTPKPAPDPAVFLAGHPLKHPQFREYKFMAVLDRIKQLHDGGETVKASEVLVALGKLTEQEIRIVSTPQGTAFLFPNAGPLQPVCPTVPAS